MSYKTILICLIATLVFASVSVFKGRKRIEDFESRSETKNSEFCEYKSDTGYTCPLVVTDRDTTIRPFKECDEHAKEAVSRALIKEWGSEYTVKYIEKMWEGTDVLYVMTLDDGSFVGCAAVDRKQFVPVLSHLYVTESERNRGRAKQLLEVVDKYVQVLGFNEIKLWCDPELQKFYETMGWQIESKKTENGKNILVMHKIL